MAKDKAAGAQPKKSNGDGPGKGAAAGEGAQAKPQLTMLALYVRDLSFESPNAPQSLQGPGENPQLRVNVNVNAGPRGEETYESVLQLEVHASSDLGVIYNVELQFGGLFRLRGVPENLVQPVLFVDCATILFPFARRILADAIRDGGFPPLLLDPIDFARMYAAKFTPAEPAAKN
ncbi:MAG: protein-export chaperone SecB [Methyloceanibacter sp.]